MTPVQQILHAIEEGIHLHPTYWKQVKSNILAEEGKLIEKVAQQSYDDGYNDESYDYNYGKHTKNILYSKNDE